MSALAQPAARHPSGMIQLVYQSVTELDDGSSTFFVEVARILETSLTNNVSCSITGVLGYAGGRFLQILEGPAASVAALYDRIAADPRHRDVRILSRGTVEGRTFGAWSMAFVGHGGAGRLFDLIAHQPDPASEAYRTTIDAIAALVG